MKMCIAKLLGFAVLLYSHAIHSHAMTFEVVMMRGEPVIVGRGQIIAGDAGRLRAVLTPRAKHSSGYYPLILDSPGGDVTAALEVSKVMDAHHVNTYIPPGAKCISACAAIVFIAGREHVAVPGGLLGFHGCFDSNTKKLVSLCNEEIASHAIAHGTAYGAVMAFIENVPHDQVVWVRATDADCWGISRYDISPQPPNYQQCVFNALNPPKK
jgi:hypothetical protein